MPQNCIRPDWNLISFFSREPERGFELCVGLFGWLFPRNFEAEMVDAATANTARIYPDQFNVSRQSARLSFSNATPVRVVY
jgi:hypothetical protein